MREGFLALLLFLSVTGFATEENSGNEAVQWLERMNKAVISMDYEGHFVYQCGTSLEAMRLRHQIGLNGPLESLSSLTGVPREVVRDSESITIITNRNGKLHITQQPAAGKLSPLKSIQPEKLLQNYRITLGGSVRIAGRPGVVINLVPNDSLRYGYRLTLDKLSALPLDLTVVDDKGNIQSRIMFTDIKITDIDLVSLQDSVGTTGMENPLMLANLEANMGNAEITRKPALAPVQPNETVWDLRSLPSGFDLVRHQKSPQTGLEHFVFSDGLATVSAYLEPLDSEKAFEGYTNLGTVRVLGRRLKDYQLTIVGEVPKKTLKLMAASIQYHKS
ncbi:MucB/RseB C-terminal domain-containing protein [Thiolapillus sp.]|uniref:MucB/RseB C-terminal domain-containing protein n=1 Tax=Thiolapillus sp. TaxID=2017437 RepID=UPI003AF7CBB3